jgi:hypothetical protein
MTAEFLFRRQLEIAALAAVLLVAVLLFDRSQSQSPPPVRSLGPAEVYVQAHRPADPGSPGLAYLQLGLAGVVSVVVVGHAARVVAFVFRKEPS